MEKENIFISLWRRKHPRHKGLGRARTTREAITIMSQAMALAKTAKTEIEAVIKEIAHHMTLLPSIALGLDHLLLEVKISNLIVMMTSHL